MREIQETWVGFLGRGMIPWRRKWQPAPVFLPGTFRGQRSLVDYKSPRGPRVRHDRAHVHAWLGGHQVSVLGQGSGRHCTNLWSSYSESCPLSAESLYLVAALSPRPPENLQDSLPSHTTDLFTGRVLTMKPWEKKLLRLGIVSSLSRFPSGATSGTSNKPAGRF